MSAQLDVQSKTRTETKVQTAVDNDTNNGGDETTVETGDTVGSKGLPVDVDETVELTGSSLGGGFVVVR